MRPLFTLLTALALPFLGGVDAFWRMGCSVVQTGRVDPLVNPGTVAAHAHTIVGSSNIGVNATYASLNNAACTSCEIEADKSAYWSPLLYYNYPNGTFIEVPHQGSVVYYLSRGQNATNVPFPPGLMILTGNKAARSYDNETMTWGNATYPGRPVADRISFACLTAGISPPSQPYMFTPTQCINGMRAQIAFQSCWNGVDLYKSDNSHVAYLSSIDNGICPPGYEYQIPLLFIETDYATNQVPVGTDESLEDTRYVFSQGDPTGFGFHADFQNGWDVDVLAEAVDECLLDDVSGVIGNCSSLFQSNTNAYQYNCPEQPMQIGEPVHGLIDNLPGCIEITYGPDVAPAASMECPASSPKPSITSTVDSTPRPTASPAPGAQYGSPDHTYMGCYNDSGGSYYRTLNELSTVNYTAMTVEWCQAYCTNNGYRLSGVEYAQECHCDNEINPTSLTYSNVSSRDCTWLCGGTLTANFDGPQELCGGYGYIMVYNNTDPTFNAYGSMSNTAGNALPYTPANGFGPNYMGCYSDSTAGRTLTGATFQQNNMSLEICAAYCSQPHINTGDNGIGYQYYGLEYASQCYCGNEISSPGVLLTPDTTPTNDTCQLRCVGAGAEICGGQGAMSLYNNTAYKPPVNTPSVGKYHTGQCLTDPNTSGRSLQGSAMSNANMTIEMCVKYCLGNFYHYAGTEYSTQCYCDNAIAAGVVGSCNVTHQMTCGGNPYEYCGGAGFMNLYYSSSL